MENSSKWKIFETGGIAGKTAKNHRAAAEAVAPRRPSPGASALADHGLICGVCRSAAKAGMGITSLCGAGWILATAALKNRARRTVAA